jgi:hypothetical protein
MGRKKRSFNATALEQFICTEAGSASVQGMGRSERNTRIFSERECLIHCALITPEGRNKRKDRLGCHLCGLRTKQKPSKWEIFADEKIREVFTDCNRLITQARLLKGWRGGIDFTIIWEDNNRELHLDIEVDGEQHENKPDGRDEGAYQCFKDERKNNLFLEQKRRLVRLHFMDLESWSSKLLEGKQDTEKNPTSTFIHFTQSYERPSIVTS